MEYRNASSEHVQGMSLGGEERQGDRVVRMDNPRVVDGGNMGSAMNGVISFFCNRFFCVAVVPYFKGSYNPKLSIHQHQEQDYCQRCMGHLEGII
jgi:hypothetical protein